MNIWPGFSIRTSLNKERAGRREAILLVSGVLLLVLAAASICMGAVPVTLRELAEALTTGETTTSAGRIIWFVRMPRTLAAILAGSALAVSGAHMVLFTTGRGTPFASPVPTVKISSNSALAGKKNNWIDFNAGILAQGADMQETTEVFFKKLLAIASGEQTQSEKHDYREIAIFKDGVTL